PDPAGRGNGRLAASPAHKALPDEPVHLPAVHIDGNIRHPMGTARVDVGDEMVRSAAAASRFRHAHRRPAVLHWDSRRAWVGSEVGVERAVLLHHDDHVLDLVDARWDWISSGRVTSRPPGLTR